MSQSKPPHDSDRQNAKPKQQLAILTDIEKSARAEMERLGQVITEASKPISGILSATDLNASARIISDIISSPAFQQASVVLAETQKLASNLAEPVFKLNEAGRAIIEPVQRIQESVIALNNQYHFGISTEALALPDITAIVNPDFDIYTHTRYPTPKPLAVLLEKLEDFKAEVISKIDEKFDERIDKLIEKRIIPAGIKNTSCHCSKCGNLLMKISDISHFITGTIKCGQCQETLQIPRDLRFKSQKD